MLLLIKKNTSFSEQGVYGYYGYRDDKLSIFQKDYKYKLSKQFIYKYQGSFLF